MNKYRSYFKFAVAIIGTALLSASCTNDLNTIPIDPNVQTAPSVYTDLAGYDGVMAKIYGGFTNTGQQGGGGQEDISGIDEGQSGYLRGLWNLQELPTDEAVCAWGDAGIQPLNKQLFTTSNSYVQAFYYRLYFQIALVNEFLRQSSDNLLEQRGQADLMPTIHQYRAEARFVRAFCYWQAIDLYGAVPLVTEDQGVGKFLPEQISRTELYNWIQNELDETAGDLAPETVRNTDPQYYGRVGVTANWMLKSKLFLNAKVYTGTAQWDSTAFYAKKVIDAYPEGLEPNYRKLFSLDNNMAGGVLFGIAQNADYTQSYGSIGFVIFSSTGGNINASNLIGINGGWGGNRAKPTLPNSFDDSNDVRGLVGEDNTAMFFDNGNIDVTDPSQFTDGFAVTKFKNRNTDGSAPARFDWTGTDFPMLRLADAYLAYAEAIMWRDGGSTSDVDALQYLNAVRTRAGASTQSTIDKNFMVNELMREFYWEARRRTDLVRFGLFTGDSYVWQWKGGEADGIATPEFRNLFPIPSSEIGANPTLTQNPGY